MPRFQRWGFVLLASLLALACSKKPTGNGDDDDDASPTPSPSQYVDNWVQLDQLDIPAPFPESLEVLPLDDGRVLFCTSRHSLLVADAADPADMVYVGQVNSSLSAGANPRCQHVAYSPGSDVVYIASRGDEIQPTPFLAAFDFSSFPPSEITTFTQANSSFEGVAAVGDMLYVGLHEEGLGIFQLVGTNLNLVNTVGGFDNAWGVSAVGTTVYVADGVGGLKIVDATTPAAASIEGSVSTGGFAQSVVVEGTVAYVAAGAAGLVNVDVSDTANPQILGSYNTPGSALQVSIASSRAYVADWNDSRIYDVSDPANPVHIATETIPVTSEFSRVLGIGARGDHAFIGEWMGFYSYEFTPDTPSPDIRSSPTLALDFGVVDPGSDDQLGVTLFNEGQEPLVIYDIFTTGDEFSVSPTALSVEPGDVGFLTVTFAPGSIAEVQGTLTMFSDDPDESALSIDLAGNVPGTGVGDVAPEITLALLSGGTWRLSEQGGSIVVLAYFATF